MKVVVVDGGWAGWAASLSVRKQGAEVVLIERSDMLPGTDLVCHNRRGRSQKRRSG